MLPRTSPEDAAQQYVINRINHLESQSETVVPVAEATVADTPGKGQSTAAEDIRDLFHGMAPIYGTAREMRSLINNWGDLSAKEKTAGVAMTTLSVGADLLMFAGGIGIGLKLVNRGAGGVPTVVRSLHTSQGDEAINMLKVATKNTKEPLELMLRGPANEQYLVQASKTIDDIVSSPDLLNRLKAIRMEASASSEEFRQMMRVDDAVRQAASGGSHSLELNQKLIGQLRVESGLNKEEIKRMADLAKEGNVRQLDVVVEGRSPMTWEEVGQWAKETDSPMWRELDRLVREGNVKRLDSPITERDLVRLSKEVVAHKRELAGLRADPTHESIKQAEEWAEVMKRQVGIQQAKAKAKAVQQSGDDLAKALEDAGVRVQKRVENIDNLKKNTIEETERIVVLEEGPHGGGGGFYGGGGGGPGGARSAVVEQPTVADVAHYSSTTVKTPQGDWMVIGVPGKIIIDTAGPSVTDADVATESPVTDTVEVVTEPAGATHVGIGEMDQQKILELIGAAGQSAPDADGATDDRTDTSPWWQRRPSPLRWRWWIPMSSSVRWTSSRS